MSSSVVKRLIFLCALMALPARVFAQEATVIGTITVGTVNRQGINLLVGQTATVNLRL